MLLIHDRRDSLVAAQHRHEGPHRQHRQEENIVEAILQRIVDGATGLEENVLLLAEREELRDTAQRR